jgi:hypothetical protein
MKRNFERIALVVVAVLTLGIMVASIHFERTLSNQKALFYQLQAIRMAISLYNVINERLPENLYVLLESEYSFPGDDIPRRFLQGAMVDGQRRVLDPFGNPYNYSVDTGWARSSSPGYEYW